MIRWRQDNVATREAFIAGLEQSRTAAQRLATRRPRAYEVTTEAGIAIDERDVVHAIIDRAYDALYEAIEALEVARHSVDVAHRLFGYIPSEWTRADTLRWMERPDLYGCTEEDVAEVERYQRSGIFPVIDAYARGQEDAQ
jgi:hypothetical protein